MHIESIIKAITREINTVKNVFITNHAIKTMEMYNYHLGLVKGLEAALYILKQTNEEEND